MRTDPRADEVRNIVEEVFSGLFCRRNERQLRQSAFAAWNPADAENRSFRNKCATFPRLYEPDYFESQTSDIAVENEDVGKFLPEIDETILIDQGRYVARSYRTEGHMAMWLVDVGIVQFYDDSGQMLATINLFELLRPQRMAG